MSPSSRVSLPLSVISYLSPPPPRAGQGQLDGWRLLAVCQPGLSPSLVFSLRGILTVPTRYLPTYLAMQPTNIGYYLRRVVSRHHLLSRPSSPHLIKEHQQAGRTLLRGCAQIARSPVLSQTTTDDTDDRPANWTFRRLALSANV